MDTAQFWKRTFSFIIDLVIIDLVIFYPFNGVFANFFNINIGSENIPSSIYFIVFIISLLAWLYFTFFEYYLGQSPGQMLTKIRVISIKDVKGKSESLNFWQALLRNCFILPFFPFYILWIMEPFYLAFYKERFLERLSVTRTVSDSLGSTGGLKGFKLEKVK